MGALTKCPGAAMATEPSPALFALTDGIAARFGDCIVLFARVTMGILFLVPAWMGLGNIGGTAGYLAGLGVPAPGLMVWLALLGELGIGIGLILGIATRYVAFFTFVFLIVTIVLAHRFWTFPAAQQANESAHFLKNLALLGGALMLFWSGAGRYSVDAKLR
jgi:putative oxidoreductase